ncbi:MAG: PEGA domain-containing protein [Alphaproteobacteria bacterium]|nr:PEGA domain-containing protein [Alphaproteobacteria bacterium]
MLSLSMMLLGKMTLGGLALAAEIKVTDAEGERLYVFVNGNERGRTPTTVKVPEGSHTISVKSVPYLAANLSYTVEVDNKDARGELEFSWQYERAEFAWSGDDMRVVVGEEAAADPTRSASGVRAGHHSSSSLEAIGEGGQTGSTTTGGGSSTTSSGSTSGGTGSSSSSGGSSGSSGSTASSDGGSTSSSGSGSTSSSGSGSTSSSGSGSTASADGSSGSGSSGSGSSGSGSSGSGSSGSGSSGSGSSSSGGASGSGSTEGGDAVADLDPGAFNPGGPAVEIDVPPFDPDLNLQLLGAAGPYVLSFEGEAPKLPEGPNTLSATLGDKTVSYPVTLSDGASLPLPWGVLVDDGSDKEKVWLFEPTEPAQSLEFRVDLPEPMDFPAPVVADVTPLTGVVQRYRLDLYNHPAAELYPAVEDALLGRQKASKITGGLVGAGVALGLAGAGSYLAASNLNGKLDDINDPAEYASTRRNAYLLLYTANGLGVAGLGLAGTGIIYRVSKGRKLVTAHTEAEKDYKEALREPVDVEELRVN